MTVTRTESLTETWAKEVCDHKGYTYQKPLGGGGMGDVFLVTGSDGHSYALKILKDSSDLAKQLFSYEIEALQNGNACTVRLYDSGQGRCYWYLMDYFPENLQVWIEKHRDTQEYVDQGLKFFRQALQGLAGWHSGKTKVICHGDINPTNILLNVAAKGAVLSDPSLASIRGPHGTNYTNQRPEGGTPGFVDPNPTTSGTPQGDIYQAGATLYALLTRNCKLPTSGLFDLVQRDTSLPEEFKNVILRCLDPNLERRYQNASQLLEDFERTWRPPDPAPSDTSQTEQRHWLAAHRRTVVRTLEVAALVLTFCSSLAYLTQVVRWNVHGRTNPATRTQTPPSTVAQPPILTSPAAAASPVSAGPRAAGAAFRDLQKQGASPSSLAPPKTLQPRAADYLALGDAAQARGDLQEAQRLYHLAIDARPQDPAPHRALGLLYRHVHDDAGARDQLGQYLRLAPAAPDRQEIERIIRMLEP
jgi:serine/threonine protein kinase